MSNMSAFSDFLDREDIMEINEDLRNLSQTLGKEINKPTDWVIQNVLRQSL